MRNKKLIAIFCVLTVLTLLILLNSVIFSVQHVNAYCYNADGEDIQQSILDAGDIRRGSSIFLLNESRVISDIEKKVAGIRVVNVERKFPNIVYINYVRIFEYLKLVDGNNVYCISNDGEVLRTLDISEALSIDLVELRIKDGVKEVDSNNRIVLENQLEQAKVEVVLDAFSRLIYRNDFIRLFDSIDFTKNFVYLRTKTGVYWEIQSIENAFEKLRLAHSTYISYGANSEMWQKGTLIISGGESFKASYSERDRYQYGVG